MKFHALIILVFVIIFFATPLTAQTTEFAFQGQLQNSGMPASGSYDFEFLLYDAVSGGTQVGTTQTRSSVTVANGTFNVNLDFGANYPGANRFLEIHVRQTGGGIFTPLTPRQAILSAPYSVKSLSTDNAATATNALQLGGIPANQFVQSNDTRLSDARSPLPSSGNYIQNTNTTQVTSNFNISGDGTAGGTLSGSAVNSTTQYNIAGSRILTTSSFFGNIFAGNGSGTANTTGASNSFFGNQSGQSNVTGADNSFFGKSAGNSNTGGSNNSFFGEQSGFGTATGGNNSFFGQFSGRNNQTGTDNAFFGYRAGANNTASGNSFFGSGAGDSVTTGTSNAFFGRNSGAAVITGAGNAFFGYHAGTLSTASNNTFVGAFAGDSNIIGTNNAFFGKSAGTSNTGNDNSFFGSNSGLLTSSGENNVFVGSSTGFSNTTGNSNSFFGESAGFSNSTGGQNAMFGASAGRLTTAGGNAFFGANSGELNSSGSNNVFIGRYAGNANTTGRLNTIIGWSADVGSTGLEYATAIGAGAVVTTNQTVVLGRASDSVKIPGGVVIEGQVEINGGTSIYQLTLPNIAAGQLCITSDHGVVRCAGSLLPEYNDKQAIENQTQIAEQQKQLQQLQKQIVALKQLVCAQNPQAEACKQKEK